MKRWTSRDESGWYHLRNVAGGKPTVKMLTQRLGPYEDTGMTPEQIEAMKAENERLHKENFWLTGGKVDG